MRSCWRIHLAKRASRDFFEIMAWTAANFGPRQAEVYAETLTLALTALSEGPEIPEVRKRDEIGEGIRTLHVARQGRKGRHFIVFRLAENQVIEVLRLLHDSFDNVPANLPAGADLNHIHGTQCLGTGLMNDRTTQLLQMKQTQPLS